MTNVITELQKLRREKQQLTDELTKPMLLRVDHENAKDGVDYRYMRAVRIQSIDRKINQIKRDNIKVVWDGT